MVGRSALCIAQWTAVSRVCMELATRLLPNATAALIQAAVLLDRESLRSPKLVDALILLAEVAMEQDDLRSAYDFACMALEVDCDDLRLTNLAGNWVCALANACLRSVPITLHSVSARCCPAECVCPETDEGCRLVDTCSPQAPPRLCSCAFFFLYSTRKHINQYA